MKAAVISLGSISSKWLVAAMKKYFDVVDSIDIKEIEVAFTSKGADVLYQGKTLQHYDCLFLRGSFRYGQLLRSIATALEKKTYIPFVPSAFTIGHDKLLTHLKLAQNKIPMPATYVSSTASAAKDILEKASYPVVLKFPQGTQGKGVMFADSFSSATSMLDALQALNQPVIIQEYVETGGTDIRAMVVGDKVVAAMQRTAIEGEKRANIHAGAKGEHVELDYNTKQMAVKTAEVVGADICAVDIMESIKGTFVIEVNMSPGFQGITEATGVDVAEKIADYLYAQTRKFVDSEIEIETSKILSSIDTSSPSSIIANIDLKLKNIVLPDVVTDMSGFKNGDEIIITADKNSIIISKSGSGKKKLSVD